MNEELDLHEMAPWLVGFITFVGGWLRTLLLAAKGMWLDETFSVWLANQSVSDMLQWIVKIDQHPPLYYFMLHYWVAFKGDTPYDARLLSVLFGVGTIPVIYLIGKRLSNALVGLAAAVFITSSLFNIYYAQEARMYTLLAFNAAVAIYALSRLLTDSQAAKPIGSQFREYLQVWRTAETIKLDANGLPYESRLPQRNWRAWLFRPRWLPIRAIETDLAWVVFILFSAATLLSHNTAVLFLLTINIFVLGLILSQRKRIFDIQPALLAPSLGNWVKAQIGILLLWSPWLYFFIKQTSSVYRRFWIPEPTWESILQALRSFLNPSLAYLETNLVTALWVLYALALCLGLLHFRKTFSRFLFLAALFAIPFLGELIVSLWRPIFYDRTLIWLTIPLFLILAAGIAQLRFRLLILIALGGAVTVNLFSAGDYYRFFQKEDWSTPAGYVALYVEEGDLILFNSNFVEIPFNYYFMPYEKQYALQVVKQGVPLDLFDSGILEPEMTESDLPRLISLINEHNRVWLVYSHDSYTDPLGLIPQTLAAKMILTRQRDFYGGQVQLYETP